MPKSGAYEISLLVNGQPLHEYDPPEDENDTDADAVVKYVEATEGAEFYVDIKIRPNTEFPTGSKGVTIKIDGKFVDGCFVHELQHRVREGGWSRLRTGRPRLENGAWVERPLMFKRRTTTEEVIPLQSMKELAKNVGCIKVDIDDIICTPARHVMEEAPVDLPVPEKALKGQPIDVTAGYGSAKVVTKPISYSTQQIGKRLAKIVIKYRSRRALQLLDLIPTTPEPQPLEECDVDTLSPQEMRELLTRMRQQENQSVGRLANLKHESVQIEDEEDSVMRPRKRQSSTLSGEDQDDCVFVEVKKRKVAPQEVDVLDLT